MMHTLKLAGALALLASVASQAIHVNIALSEDQAPL